MTSGWKWRPRRKKYAVGPKHAQVYVWTVRDTPASLPRFTSWGWALGPWGRNVTRGTEKVDLPGPWDVKRKYR